jgi:hypothetical protein
MRHFIFILLILSSFLVQGQVILRASTSPFPNSNLYVGISNSQLTQNLTFISESKTNHNGGFQVEINNRYATDYSELFICIQNTMALIYVEPDGKYSITYSEEDTLSTHNGFIKQWSLLVEEEATIPFNAILSSFELH